MTPAAFERWRDETPNDFVFALKANRFTTNRRVLAEAGESVARFVGSGLGRLGNKLGPLLWQFAPTKKFDAPDFEAFLKLLPREAEGQPLRHVLDVRNDSFRDPAFLALARRYEAGVVLTDSPDYPNIADLTTDFVYLRLMRAQADLATGYAPEVLDTYAACAQAWAEGGQPGGLPLVEADAQPPKAPRDVFVFMINGAKERAPKAATELLQRLGLTPSHPA
jgi:uncharacterized protein YecE (DUF72 family)